MKAKAQNWIDCKFLFVGFVLVNAFLSPTACIEELKHNSPKISEML